MEQNASNKTERWEKIHVVMKNLTEFIARSWNLEHHVGFFSKIFPSSATYYLAGMF